MNRVFRKKDDIITRDIVGETLLVPIRGELANMQKLFALEDVSAYIWERLNGDNSLEEILKHLLKRYEIDSDQVQNDLLEFVDELIDAELIELAS